MLAVDLDPQGNLSFCLGADGSELCASIYNVLKGEMSFVGVRPEIPPYVKMYTKEMYATLLLPAGITSLASIKYRNESKILNGTQNINQKYIHVILPKKMFWNLKEIENFSLLSEGKLVLYTIKAVL